MLRGSRSSNIGWSPVPLPPNSCGAAFGRVNTVDPLGGTGGIYYDFLKLGPVKLGADLRGSILTTKRGANVSFNASGTRIYSVLGGVRAVFHTPMAPLKPYIQGSVGLGRSDYGLSSTTSSAQVTLYNHFEYEGL